MSRSKTPTEQDKKRLELFASFLQGDDLTITCGCGEDDACHRCDIELTSDDLYVRSHQVNRLSLRVSLSDLDPESKLAVRYNADDRFADAVDIIEEQLDLSLEQPAKAAPDDQRMIENFTEAVELIGRIKGADMLEVAPESTPKSANS